MLKQPPKTPKNSSVPPSKGQKPNQPDKAKRLGPRKGSLGRDGGGRELTADPDDVVVAKPARCRHCQMAFADADQTLDARYDKIDVPPVRPVVTRVERYGGRCRCCGATTLAPVPEGMEPGTPFSLNIVALAMYLRFVHALSYRRLSRLMLDLFGLSISEGALDGAFRRGKLRFDADVAAILSRLRRARVIYSDETRRACRRTRLLELGVPERRRGDPRDPPQPWRGRGGRGAGWASSGVMGVRPLWCSAGAR